MMGKIKVLHIIKSLGRGGAEMLLPETLKLHDPSRFKFYYVYFLPWKNQMVKAIEDSGGEVHCFSSQNNWKILSQFSSIEAFCKREGIDLIHCHLPWSGFVGRIVFKRTGIPLVYTEHNIQERYHVLTKLINKTTFNFQSVALGVSKDVTQSIKENIAPKIPVQTLLNGVNTHYFSKDIEKGKKIREIYNIPQEATVVGNIAVFREQKNIPVWLKAFQKINSANSQVYGLLVGAGPLEKEVQEIVQDLELTDKVKLTGLQTDTVSFFSAMDIFMMSSAFEGLPIALLEAMSMNCAIVSTKAGGVVEAVRDKKDGVLCEVGDWENLANLCLDLIENEEKRQEFQARARERVEESFSLRSMVDSLEEVYSRYANVQELSKEM